MAKEAQSGIFGQGYYFFSELEFKSSCSCHDNHMRNSGCLCDINFECSHKTFWKQFLSHVWKPSGWERLIWVLSIAGCYENFCTELTDCHHLLAKLICNLQLARGGFRLNNRKQASGHQISHSFCRYLSYQFNFSCKIVFRILWIYYTCIHLYVYYRWLCMLRNRCVPAIFILYDFSSQQQRISQ